MDSTNSCVLLDDALLNSWRAIASAKRLTTNGAVARFLVQLFYSTNQTESRESNSLCVHCRTPLVWYCTTCQLYSQPALLSSSPHTQHSSLQRPLISEEVSDHVQQAADPETQLPQQTHHLQDAQPTLPDPPQQMCISEVLPSPFSNAFDGNKRLSESEDGNTGTVYSDTESAEYKLGTCASVIDAAAGTINSENQDSSSAPSEEKSNLSSKQKQTKSVKKENEKLAISRTTSVKYNFRKNRNRGSSLKVDEMHLKQKLNKKRELKSVLNTNQAGNDKQKLTAVRTVQCEDTNTKVSINSAARTCLHADTQNSVPASQNVQTPVTENLHKENENSFFVTLSGDSENGCGRTVTHQKCDVNQEGQQYSLQDLHKEELKKKIVCSRPKGRPRSKLISGKYLGTLKKANGQVRFYSRFECAHCQQIFDRKKDFNSHISVHYLSKPHICIKCGEGFQTRLELKQHRQTVHSKLSKQPKFMCDQCPAEFKTEGRFELHKKLHEQNKLFACKSCGFVASSKEALNSHRLTHRKMTRVQCEYCGETKRVNNMQRHLLMHRGEKPYTCSQCGAGFRTPFDLKDHTKRRHSEVKPFSCEICGKGFICSDNLKHHLRVHNGQKPFKCSMCPSSFSRKDYLTKHIRTHTGEKPYKCSECEETFAYPNSLKLHRKQYHTVSAANNSTDQAETQRKYTPQKCTDCEDVFDNASSLEIHRKQFHIHNIVSDMNNSIDEVRMLSENSDCQASDVNSSTDYESRTPSKTMSHPVIYQHHCTIGLEGQGYPGFLPAGIWTPAFPTPGS